MQIYSFHTISKVKQLFGLDDAFNFIMVEWKVGYPVLFVAICLLR